MAVMDLWYGIIMMLVISVAIAVGFLLYNSLNSSPIATLFAATPAAAEALPRVGTTLDIFDGIFLIIFISIGIGGVASSFLIDSHPVFFGAMLLINVILVLVSAMFSDSFESFITGMGTVGNQMPITVWTMRSLPILSLISMIVTAVFAAKIHSSGGGR